MRRKQARVSHTDRESPPGSPRVPVGALYSQARDTWEKASHQARETWEKARKRCQLIDFSSCPSYMRDNEYIHKYYRANWPLKQALLSVFKIHNETLNIWTHLIGFLLFLGLTIYTAWHLPVQMPKLPAIPSLTAKFDAFEAQVMAMAQRQMNSYGGAAALTLERAREMLHSAEDMALSAHVQTLDRAREMLHTAEEMAMSAQKLVLDQWHSSDFAALPFVVTRWPFFVFLTGAMVCLLSSSTCHLIACHSEKVSRICWRFDYCGIAVMIATSFFPPVYYGFLCNPVWRNIYLTGITVFGIATIVVSLLSFFQTPKYRTFRASLFFGMGFSGAIPCIHKLLVFHDEPEAYTTTLLEIAMGLLYGLGAVVYAARIPERLYPGKFDIAGSSHQIFHLFVVAGAYTHYHAGLLYLKWRDGHVCPT